MKFLSASALIMALSVALFSGSALADGDAAKGEKVFRKCKACHSVDEGGKHKVGPNLFGVVGRAVAGTDFKKYKGLSADDGVWDEETLDKWLENPKKFNGKKSGMALKLKKEDDRENVIAYLKTLQ
ncbi:MAG: c-type cytochrome [Rhodospirillales bacterium]|nr:c-type cytochrome [Rhodospirillales bacterium]